MRRVPIWHVFDRDVLAAVLIVGLLAGIAAWNRVERLEWLGPDQIDHLGAEYDSIAQAIRQGRGFADPFRTESGPTAWMPPVLPAITALLYWLTGDDRQQVVWIVYALQLLVLTWTAWLVLRQARALGVWSVGVVALVVLLVSNFHELFQLTHDCWLVLLAINGMWLGLARFDRLSTWWHFAGWGAWGGVLALVSPVLGFTWAVSTAVRLRPVAGASMIRWKKLFIVAGVAGVVVSPWLVRNRLVLGAWVPIKSNGIYEVWQSLCTDDDGVLDGITMSRHPWASAGAQRREYVKKGEMAFVRDRWEPVWEFMREEPLRTAEKVLNRMAAATVDYRPSYRLWIRSSWFIAVQEVVHVLPIAGLVVSLFLLDLPWDPRFRAAVAIYATYLLPYVLISYYERYGVPLIGLKCVFVVFAAHAVERKLSATEQRPQQSSS
ncbi:MAG: hypothetical protein KatS3mg111_3632 [Pirellulaceae bacterium]|nr:MAG: hypothetical protein KatS3mg111_3632 [Pirellulaceae bacterium]